MASPAAVTGAPLREPGGDAEEAVGIYDEVVDRFGRDAGPEMRDLVDMARRPLTGTV